MRILKLIGALAVVLAFTAITTATASAAETLWVWLPGTPTTTFEGKSGAALLSIPNVKADIHCEKSLTLLTDSELKVSSELLKEGEVNGMATLALAVVHFEGCTSGGLPANSLGDKGGIILAHLEIHNCMIKKEHFGLLIKPLPLHIEIPEAKLLVEVLGDVLALIEALPKEPRHFELNLHSVKKEDKEQELKKCEGGVEEKLEASIDETPQLPATEDVEEGLILFDNTEGQVLMEK